MKFNLKIRWGTSRGRDTYGYTTCSLFETQGGWANKKIASCNGGGYDMKGTVLGDWIAKRFPSRLRELKEEFYGLSFHDPNFNVNEVVVPGTNQTVAEREKAGESIGLERYQAFHGESSKLPTKNHTVPQLDGACGFSCMEKVLKAIGGTIERVGETGNCEFFVVEMPSKKGDVWAVS